jgi:hypothetical protein
LELYGRRPWGLAQEEGWGKGSGRGLGAWCQGGGREGGAPWGDCSSILDPCLLAEREEEEVEEREEKEKREKEKKIKKRKEKMKNC